MHAFTGIRGNVSGDDLYSLLKEPPHPGTDVGEYMGCSKPSVSRAMGLLKTVGYVSTDEEGFLSLTEEGREIAVKIYERHTVLADLLIRLGVDEKTAVEDARRMEHVISDRSFQAIRQRVEK